MNPCKSKKKPMRLFLKRCSRSPRSRICGGRFARRGYLIFRFVQVSLSVTVFLSCHQYRLTITPLAVYGPAQWFPLNKYHLVEMVNSLGFLLLYRSTGYAIVFDEYSDKPACRTVLFAFVLRF
jgi:hypothetical protein